MPQVITDRLIIIFVSISLIYFLYPRQTHISRIGSIIQTYETNCNERSCFCLLTYKKIGKYINWSDELIETEMQYKGKCNNASKD